jgi:hypothetical protein
MDRSCPIFLGLRPTTDEPIEIFSTRSECVVVVPLYRTAENRVAGLKSANQSDKLARLLASSQTGHAPRLGAWQPEVIMILSSSG